MTVPERCVYLYAVVPARTSLPPIEGRPDIRLVPAGDVALVVGTPDIAALSRINDPESDSRELAELARRHDAVVRAVMSVSGSVLPFRLATVVADEDAASDFARRHATEYADLLRRLAGAGEWGVRITAERTAPAAGRPDRGGDRPGTAHLDRRRRELAESQRRADDRTEVAARAARELGGLAVDSVRGHGGVSVLVDESYLVRDADTDRLLDTARRVRDRLARYGLLLRLSGPWPPYSFSRLGGDP